MLLQDKTPPLVSAKHSMRYGEQMVLFLVALGAWQMYLYHGRGGEGGQSISSYMPQVFRGGVSDLQQALGAQLVTPQGILPLECCNPLPLS